MRYPSDFDTPPVCVCYSRKPPATARSSSPPPRHIPTDEAIQNVIERATANARAANGGRSPVIGRDTRTQLFVGNVRPLSLLIPYARY